MKYNFLYRDSSFPKSIIDQYFVGETINEKAFVDTSKFRGRILTDCNIRYLIISKQGKDWQSMNERTERWGFVLFPNGLDFKILDVYKIGDITQVLLSPDDVNKYDIKDLIKSARYDFDETYNMDPIASLDTSEWKERLYFPIGIIETIN